MFKLEVVEDAIILNIDIIRDIKHLRPSAQVLFETINKDPGFEGTLNIEQFIDAMDSLEKEGIIYLSGEKGGEKCHILMIKTNSDKKFHRSFVIFIP